MKRGDSPLFEPEIPNGVLDDLQPPKATVPVESQAHPLPSEESMPVHTQSMSVGGQQPPFNLKKRNGE